MTVIANYSTGREERLGFLMRLRIGYPDVESEREIIRRPEVHHGETTPHVLNLEELIELQDMVKRIQARRNRPRR